MSIAALQPAHRVLALKVSMTLAYKAEDFVYAAFFAKKLIAVQGVRNKVFFVNIKG